MTISELFQFVAASSITDTEITELREYALKAEQEAEESASSRITTASDLARTYSL